MSSGREDIDAEAPTASADAVAPTLDSRDGHGGLDVPVGAHVGRFVVTGVLGQGGMGVVVSARDPKLDRVVAVKLLRPDRGTDDGVRLGREAQAMARLSHPNVVTVYEVGEHDGSTYIAMERIDGRTLRAWRSATPRSWREVVEIYLGAGRGLAAAHAAGLVHRDFKPDNVLIGGDGRPRVTDFGLVAAESRRIESGDARDVGLDSGITVAGALLGTPAYMAPEQWLGEPLDARTDQFAFCVALWEALHGERPFGGDTTPLLREAILAGAPRPPRARVPRWLTAALTRGLSREPSARWPQLATLLDHVTTQLRPRRWPWIAAAGGVALIGVAAAVALWPRGAAASCGRLEQRMVHVWDEPRRDAVRTVFGDAAPIVIEPLDSYASTWVSARVDACEAERRTDQTAAVRSTRAHCFDDAIVQLDAVAGAITSGTLEPPTARSAVAALPSLAMCSDLQVLTALVPRPTDAARLKRLTAVEATLAKARSEYSLGRAAAARDLCAGIRADAEAVGYPPTLGAVLLVLGQAQSDLGDAVASEETLRASLRAADAGRDDHGRLEAYMGLIGVVGPDLGKWSEARALLDDARAALARISAPKMYEARLLGYESDLVGAEGDDAKSLSILQQALPLYEAAFARDSRTYAELEYTLAGRMLSLGNVEAAEPLLDHARTVLVGYVGEESPMIGKIDNARSFARYKRGNLAGAIELQEESLAMRERTEGAGNPRLGNALYTLGAFYKEAQRTDDAVQTLQRALGLLEREHGRDHPRVVMALNELAEALLLGDRFDKAVPYAERAVDITDRLAIEPDVDAKARYMLASALWLKDRRRAHALALQARDAYRAMGDEANAKTIEAWLAAPDPD